MASRTSCTRWGGRGARLRIALALGLALAGSASLSPEVQAAHAVKDSYWGRRWMRFGTGGCRVPYQLEGVSSDVANTIYQVLNYINATTPCQWEPAQWWDGDYVAFTENDWSLGWLWDLAAHSGGTGRIGGRQEMSICYGCNNFDLILHELGHSMGLLHEHQRPDAWRTVDIYFDHIQDSAKDQFYTRFDGTDLGLPYDIRSVMHYSKYAYLSGWLLEPLTALAICGTFPCRTMELHSNPSADLGGTYFTDTDLEALRRRYPVPNRLVGWTSGKCIDVPGANPFQQAVVQQFDCHEGANQGWLLRWSEKVGGTDYYIIETADPAGAGLCLDVQWASQSPGAPVMLWPCHGGGSQQWALVPWGGSVTNGYTLRVRHSGQCLTVPDGSQDNGTTIVQSTCIINGSQTWGKDTRPFLTPTGPPPPRCGSWRDPC
jgi:astacin (peptidase family M12A)/ricin-type beta-trefoil lectin protein